MIVQRGMFLINDGMMNVEMFLTKESLREKIKQRVKEVRIFGDKIAVCAGSRDRCICLRVLARLVRAAIDAASRQSGPTAQ